jgi:hypothetical protein
VFLAMGMGDKAQLDDTVDLYPKTTAAQWALVVSGDLHLAAGCEELFTTKATAPDQLKKAQEKYRLALESCREDVIRERATYGLARCYEAMAGTRSQGDMKQLLENAVENYEKILTNWPEGAYAAAAQARIDALNQDSTKDFYDGLAKWEPRPAFASPEGLDNMNLPFDQPGAGLEVGEEPKDFFGDITERVDESITDAKEGESTEEGAPEEGAGEVDAPLMPEATGEKSAEEVPVDESAADEGAE